MPEPGNPELRNDDATAAELIDIWNDAMADLLAAEEAAGAQGWALPTPCPGWSIGDILAHTSFIERFLLQRYDPPHEPNWDELPHVTSDFGRITEIPVDLRRNWTRDAVLAEFRQTWADRSAALQAGPQDLTVKTMSPFGVLWPLDRVLRTRIFDVWVHEQDIRSGNASPADLGTPAAWVSARQLVKALPIVWAKGAEAPTGASLAVLVTGPEVKFATSLVRGEDGRARYWDGRDATVALRLAWPDLVRLMCGRGQPEEVAIHGDAALAQRLLANMSVTP